jgi:RNA polymerase sigma-70 factor (ECF subfamily)
MTLSSGRDSIRATERDSQVLERAIASAKSGDMDGLHFLYVRYADSVRTYVDSIVHDSYEAEDITQSLFAGLLTKIRRYEQRGTPFAAWLLRVARNAALDNLRSRRAIPVEEVRASDEACESPGFERYEAIHGAFERLPDAQREVLMLRHVAGLSPGEIAVRLHKTESSIHGLHHRGRGALKAALRELEALPVTAAG